MNHGYRTDEKVVLSPALYESLIERLLATERLAVQLRDRLEEEHALLLTALHDLASERDRRDHAHFVRQWRR